MKCRCHKMKWEWRTCDTTRVYGSLPFCISLIPRSSILFAINSIFYILLNIYNMYLERVTLSLRCCKINERFSIQVPRHGKTWVRMQLFFFLLFFFVLFLRFVESIQTRNDLISMAVMQLVFRNQPKGSQLVNANTYPYRSKHSFFVLSVYEVAKPWKRKLPKLKTCWVAHIISSRYFTF